jgi:hypothetical protein
MLRRDRRDLTTVRMPSDVRLEWAIHEHSRRKIPVPSAPMFLQLSRDSPSCIDCKSDLAFTQKWVPRNDRLIYPADLTRSY